MNIIKTEIDGVLIIEPRLFRDARGYFFESFSEREFEEMIAPNLGTQCSLLPRQRVYEQLWRDARSVLPASSLYSEQVGTLRKR